MAAMTLIPANVVGRISREIKDLATRPPEGIRYVEQEDDSLTEIHADIDGPVGTPYEAGVFRMKLVLGSDYPAAPPRGFFLTKVYHPNIAANGDICVNTLKRDWNEGVTLAHVLQVIRCLLIVPFPESSLNDEAGKLFLESYDEYFKRARLMTSVHAPRREVPKAHAGLTDKNGDEEQSTDVSAAKRKVAKEQKKQKENKKKGLKRL
ncbi:ubiquitin-conjugating enzyme/RWD-like protein [Pelagophyceae sp. CCMP2097]|nr:ubiquitin-conjugating enzyme/RWD-like protein [Pelagophyceae sp. CCMP2097]|mmetsp:Transcript_20506/g.69507  ORF Transcript_20506/g.69507 Transcript_20506/m.69507 type:complete len:207 (-) Transcript_20506:163-783(-)